MWAWSVQGGCARTRVWARLGVQARSQAPVECRGDRERSLVAKKQEDTIDDSGVQAEGLTLFFEVCFRSCCHSTPVSPKGYAEQQGIC